MIEQALMSSLELIFYAILYQTFMLINTLCKDEYIHTTHKHILKDLWESNLFPEKPVLTGPSWTENQGLIHGEATETIHTWSKAGRANYVFRHFKTQLLPVTVTWLISMVVKCQHIT